MNNVNIKKDLIIDEQTNLVCDKKSPIVDKEKFFNQYVDLAHSISNLYGHNMGDFKNDLDQIALMELWECIDRYDESKGAFTTYATWCITHKIKQGLMERSGIAKRGGSTSFKTMSYIMKNKDKKPEQVYQEIKDKDWFRMDKCSFYALWEGRNGI